MVRGILVAAGMALLLVLRSAMFGPLANPSTAKIPADFPSDVPVYPRYKVEQVSRLAGALVLELAVDADAQSVLTYYEQQFAAYGWQVSPASEEETEDGDGQGFSAAKEGRVSMVVVLPLKDNRCEVREMIR
jgi:hypothetical protein